MYNLKPGDGDPSFRDVAKYGVKANNHIHFIDSVADNVPPFQDLMEWSKQEGYKDLGRPFPTTEIPAELQVSERAWILFTNPAPTAKPIQFGELWPLYERQKQLHMSDRSNINKKLRWERFYKVVGDDGVRHKPSMTDCVLGRDSGFEKARMQRRVARADQQFSSFLNRP